MIDLEEERKAFEKCAFNASGGWASFEKDSNGKYWPDKLNLAWDMWVKRAEKENEENDSLKAQLAKLESGEYLIVPKSELDTCYLDENEGMYLTHSDFLAEIDIGEAVEVERQYYWKTTSLFAAITWDEANNDIGYYELFDTQEEAEKAATYCKAMIEAAKGEAK